MWLFSSEPQRQKRQAATAEESAVTPASIGSDTQREILCQLCSRHIEVLWAENQRLKDLTRAFRQYPEKSPVATSSAAANHHRSPEDPPPIVTRFIVVACVVIVFEFIFTGPLPWYVALLLALLLYLCSSRLRPAQPGANLVTFVVIAACVFTICEVLWTGSWHVVVLALVLVFCP